MTTEAEVRKTLDTLWRTDGARIIGALARFSGDIGRAEDWLQGASLKALEHWPREGIPGHPGAWLMTAAKRLAVDDFRHQSMQKNRQHQLTHHEELHRDDDQLTPPLFKDELNDDLLSLLFTACHPVLSPESREALTLRVVAGLSTEEIARAFLVSNSTMGQRISRAKKTLRAAHIPFEVPAGSELEKRLSSVLEVIYLLFNEGYVATDSQQWTRPELCEEALRLSNMLASLLPQYGEVLGLLALLHLQASRLGARVDHQGQPLLLMDQDRQQWDQRHIQHGLDALKQAYALGHSSGPYTLQAGIAACHARARQPQDTDWLEIVAHYDALSALLSSPVVELNRAVALSMAYGAESALPLVRELENEPRLANYAPLYDAKGDLLERSGLLEEAAKAFAKAASLSSNAQEKIIMQRRVTATESNRAQEVNQPKH